MKRYILFAVCLAGLLVSAALIPCAADGPVAPTKGSILILKNDRTLQGDIERSQDGYLVRREVGQLWLPTAEVKFLCGSWEQALQVMRSQVNLHDPDERLKLARWCQQNSLYPQAIAEAKQALKMRPQHAATQDYLYYLEHAAEMAGRQPAPAPVKNDLAPPPSLDLSADSLSLFVTKVQPILMNTCAQCHANGQGGDFKLMRTSGIGATWQRATQLNMAATVRQINLEDAALSPLLIKAVSAHGTATRPPLASRNSPPYQILRHWVQATIASNPHLRQELATQPRPFASPLPAPATPVSFASQASSQPPLPMFQPGAAPGMLPDLGPDVRPLTAVVPVPASDVQPADARVVPSQKMEPEKTDVIPALFTTPATPSPVKNSPPPPAARPSDEFDPLLFNQMAHPGKQ